MILNAFPYNNGHVMVAPFRHVPFFLYGDLLDPNVLASVMQLDEALVLRLATVVGFRWATWQNRSALVHENTRVCLPGAVSDGVATEAME